VSQPIRKLAMDIVVAEERAAGWTPRVIGVAALEKHHGCDILSTPPEGGDPDPVEVKGWGEPLLRASGKFVYTQDLRQSQMLAAQANPRFRIEIVANLSAHQLHGEDYERLTLTAADIEKATPRLWEVDLQGKAGEIRRRSSPLVTGVDRAAGATNKSAAEPPPGELVHVQRRYQRLLDDIRIDLPELAANGRMRRALELSEASGEHVNHNEYPLYFTGDLDAAFVLAHLNPKQVDNSAPQMASITVQTFEEYFDACRWFGARNYGPDAAAGYSSRFDHKQVRFLRPFGVIDFTGDTREDLRRMVDDKLQVELVPYGSSSFSGERFPPSALRPHFERLMSVICAHPRRYVIFCGAVFEKLLPAGSITRQHTFRLPKADGSLTKGRVRFANLEIDWEGERIRAGLAHSWALQGIPMTAYATEIAARYDAA
jgi:hypothetical protein